ncbi:Putative uncharacterized protein [Taphrina deformans PYCC 5710]|uniref:Rhodanese domain-containing protein n=1 Tax=Taphrina deformans (strain PYCC 5710 / ATCC 11124 / CBS 356.35 / IMI 108563 / JCM 9778 / NBRC 8474) TaxID=1097556 RepID=R4XC69_TAPDE|nr:Putative uncharacterized protein [Taphrina deformans PYCC 5710]|eukprot:CCG80930.1 Putative uncharacterized protein [Taphrina deformans PYCC 5710]
MARRITAAQLKSWVSETPSTVAIIDVRDADFYGGQIVNARNVPSHQFQDRLQEVVEQTKDKERVVFHCSLSQQRGPHASRVYEAALKQALEGQGRRPEVYILEGGFVGWQKLYAEDSKLTTNYDAEHWKYGFSG